MFVDEELDNFLGLTLRRLCITNPESILRVAAKWIADKYPQTKVVRVDLMPKKTAKQDRIAST